MAGPGLAPDPLDLRERKALGPAALAAGVEQRNAQALKAAEERGLLADLGARLIDVDGIVAVRRADVELQAARDQDVVDLAQALTQLRPLVRRRAGVRHLDIVADHDIGARAGDVGADAPGQQRGIALGEPAADRELIGRPLIGAPGHQRPGQRVPLDDPLDVADHLPCQIVLGGEHQDAKVGVVQQQPGAEDPDQGRLAGVAEHQEHAAGDRPAPSAGRATRRSPDAAPGSSGPGHDSRARRTGESRSGSTVPHLSTRSRRLAHRGSGGCADDIDGDRVRRAGPPVLDVDLAVGVGRIGELASCAGGPGEGRELSHLDIARWS